MYCTYLTIYLGNKLPPFYIGYTKIKNIEKNYNGTVTSQEYKNIWNSERKNNPFLFKTKILTKHETISEAKQKETYFQKFFKVDKNPMYVNKHIGGEKYYCSGHSLESREKMSLKRKGIKPKTSKEIIEKRANSRRGTKNKKPMPLDGIKRGIETMKKIRTPEWLKKFGDNLKGEKNPFYGKKHSLEAREKMSKTDRSYLSKSFWWNNGILEKRCENSPGEGWIKGRKPKNSQ